MALLNASTLETPLHEPPVAESGLTACPLSIGLKTRHWIRCVEFRKHHVRDKHNSTQWDWLCVNTIKRRHFIF